MIRHFFIFLLLAQCTTREENQVPAYFYYAQTAENVHADAENPKTAGENVHAAAENPKTAGENAHAATENPKTAGENAHAAAEYARNIKPP